MNRGYEALCMASASFYDARHAGETAGAAFPPGNAGRPAQRWKVDMTGCLGNADRIIR